MQDKTNYRAIYLRELSAQTDRDLAVKAAERAAMTCRGCGLYFGGIRVANHGAGCPVRAAYLARVGVR